ncbi:MAG: hypothetical protein R6U95_07840 [Bacteroidales bacterium]
MVDNAKLKELQNMFTKPVFYPLETNKNKIAAGWLLDVLGCKEFTVGDAAVHEKQALVLINKGHACGKDIANLAYKIISHVHTKTGIQLEPEVIFL